MEKIKLIPGHCYRLHGEYKTVHGFKTAKPDIFDFIGYYMGREEGFDCIVCGKGDNAFGFNVYQGDLEHPTKKQVEDYIDNIGYETFTFGKEHMPEVIEEIF